MMILSERLSDNASAEPLRLLVLGPAAASRAANLPAALASSRLVHASDVYTALALLASEPPFHALLLDGQALPRRAAEALTLLGKHRPLPVWLLEPARPALRAELLALGVVPLETALRQPLPETAPRRSIAVPTEPRSAATASASAACDGWTFGPAPVDVAAAKSDADWSSSEVSSVEREWPVEMPGPAKSHGARGEAASESRFSEVFSSEEEAGSAQRYDALEGQPVLTPDELRALLGT